MTQTGWVPAGLRTRRLATFVLIAYGGAWLVVLPLWLHGGLASPLARPLIAAMMLTPALAGVVSALVWRDGRRLVDVLGLRPGPFRQWWWTVLVGWFGPVLLVGVVLGVALLSGGFRLDPGTWSTFRASLPAGALPMPIDRLLLLVLVSSVLINLWITAALAVGEEIGWRGFLRDALSDRPRWLVILVTGVVWGLWHAPVILLGYNFPGLPPVAALGCMVAFTVLTAALLEWLRTVGTAVWPTAVAHGSINTASSLVLLLTPVHDQPRSVTGTFLGWPGWLVMGLAVVLLVLTGRLRLRARPVDDGPAADRPVTGRGPTVSGPRSGSASARAGAADPRPDPGASDGR